MLATVADGTLELVAAWSPTERQVVCPLDPITEATAIFAPDPFCES